jgi:hypothetical protein
MRIYFSGTINSKNKGIKEKSIDDMNIPESERDMVYK